MASLASLKKKKGAGLKKLQEKVEQASGNRPRDERLWKPTFNKDKGKGTCVVRFLTPKEGDPFVEQLSYSFNGPGGNFYDIARQTIGEEDPIQIAAINAFRKAKADDDKQLYNKAKKFLPQRRYFANVYVIKDEEKPDNEGKVFIWQFGPMIYNFIKAAIKPEFDDVEEMDPFDYWSGADFKVRMTANTIPDSKDPSKKVVVPNYEKSSFDDPSEFFDGDEDKIDEVYQQTHDLTEFVDPEKIKSFEDHATRFEKVMGHSYKWLSDDFDTQEYAEKKDKREKEDAAAEKSQSDDDDDDDYQEDDEAFAEDAKGKDQDDSESEEESSDDEDDPLARFRKHSQKK